MKKNIIAFMLVLIMAVGSLTLAGCNNKNNNSNELTIYTSFYPIYDFTTRIAGDKAKVINLVGPGHEAHDYELKPKEVASLEKDADLIIINGLDMEHFIEDLNTKILNKVFVASDGIETIELTTDLGTTKVDPHMWLSIKKAKQMMENIKNKLVELDAVNASYYEHNYSIHAFQFDLLDKAYEEAVNNFNTTTIVVSHKAFGYLTAEYGLTQVAISGLETDGEADAQTMAAIIDFIIDNNITVVYYQEELNATIASAIAESTSVQTALLLTVESLTKSQLKAGYDYLTVMTQNLLTLINTLS